MLKDGSVLNFNRKFATQKISILTGNCPEKRTIKSDQRGTGRSKTSKTESGTFIPDQQITSIQPIYFGVVSTPETRSQYLVRSHISSIVNLCIQH